jgi:ADP-heptose:LPS heptosyltransferase
MRLGGIFWPRKIPYGLSEQKNIGIHDTRSFAELIGIECAECGPLICAPPIWEETALKDARQRLAGLSRPILAVSATAASNIPQREYPLEKMAYVLEDLLSKKVVNSIVLLGDGASKARLEPLAKRLGAQCLGLCGQLSLSATGAVMRECDAALVVDGGLLHIALSTNLPVVALYGPTEIYLSDPRGDHGRYVAISAHDQCRCLCLNHRGIRPIPDCCQVAQCLATIPPGQVVDAVSTILRAPVSVEEMAPADAAGAVGTGSLDSGCHSISNG